MLTHVLALEILVPFFRLQHLFWDALSMLAAQRLVHLFQRNMVLVCW